MQTDTRDFFNAFTIYPHRIELNYVEAGVYYAELLRVS